MTWRAKYLWKCDTKCISKLMSKFSRYIHRNFRKTTLLVTLKITTLHGFININTQYASSLINNLHFISRHSTKVPIQTCAGMGMSGRGSPSRPSGRNNDRLKNKNAHVSYRQQLTSMTQSVSGKEGEGWGRGRCVHSHSGRSCSCRRNDGRDLASWQAHNRYRHFPPGTTDIPNSPSRCH